MQPTRPHLDRWASWLLQRRQGGSDLPDHALAQLHLVRDRVLDNSRLDRGDTVLDIGCGDGLIGLGALERLGPDGRAIFSDISADLLDRVRELATAASAADRSAFLQAAAEDLSALPDSSVDVVAVRSVLIYVANKSRALSEFHRVLRTGGGLSLFEPINRFTGPEPPDLFYGYNLAPVSDLLAKVRAVYDRYDEPNAQCSTSTSVICSVS